MRRAFRFAAVLGTAFALTVPGQALGQAQIGDGSAASEYGDYVPTTSGHTSTTHHSTTTHRTPPRPTYTPPVRHYYAPPRQTAPVYHPTQTTPTYSSPTPGPTHPRHRHHRRHHPHPAAATHHAVNPQPKPARQLATLPSSPASAVDGGSHQLLWLGLAMITMTVAVFARAGLRRRYGSV